MGHASDELSERALGAMDAAVYAAEEMARLRASIAAAIAAEREACAKICENAAAGLSGFKPIAEAPRAYIRGKTETAFACATAIRARSGEEG